MKKTRRREFLRTAGGMAIAGTCLMHGMDSIHAQEKPYMANKGEELKPGDRVPISGIYDVIHDKLDGDDHAQPHQVTAITGAVFPPCRGCHGWVRFRLHQAAEHMEANDQFKP